MGFFSRLFKPNSVKMAEMKKAKFSEFEKTFGGDKEFENNAKATWLVSRGNDLGDRGMLDDAQQDFEEAIRLQPDHLPAHVSRIIVYKKRGDKNRVEQLLKEMPEVMKIDGKVVATKLDALQQL